MEVGEKIEAHVLAGLDSVHNPTPGTTRTSVPQSEDDISIRETMKSLDVLSRNSDVVLLFDEIGDVFGEGFTVVCELLVILDKIDLVIDIRTG